MNTLKQTKNDIYRNLTKQEAQSFMYIAQSEIKMAIREHRDTIQDSDTRYLVSKKNIVFPSFMALQKFIKIKIK